MTRHFYEWPFRRHPGINAVVHIALYLAFLLLVVFIGGCTTTNPCNMAGMSAAELERTIARGCNL